MARKLADFIPQLQRIGQSSFLDGVRRKVQLGGLKLIEVGFDRQTDPYGKQWDAVKEHRGHRSILWDSGALRDSFVAVPISNGVRFLSTSAYAATQQYGSSARSIAARKMIPVQALGLPEPWREMVRHAFTSSVRDTVAL